MDLAAGWGPATRCPAKHKQGGLRSPRGAKAPVYRAIAISSWGHHPTLSLVIPAPKHSPSLLLPPPPSSYGSSSLRVRCCFTQLFHGGGSFMILSIAQLPLASVSQPTRPDDHRRFPSSLTLTITTVNLCAVVFLSVAPSCVTSPSYFFAYCAITFLIFQPSCRKVQPDLRWRSAPSTRPVRPVQRRPPLHSQTFRWNISVFIIQSIHISLLFLFFMALWPLPMRL